MLGRMGPFPRSTRGLRSVSAVVIVVAIVLCAISMPAMALAALMGCIAIIALVFLVGEPTASPGPGLPRIAVRALPVIFRIGTGPPRDLPLRI